jgi:hypothetical protein
VLGLPFRDLTGGFRCFKASALRAIDIDPLTASGYAFQIETIFRAARAGCSVREIPIVFPRAAPRHVEDVGRDRGPRRCGGLPAMRARWSRATAAAPRRIRSADGV